MHNTVEIIQDTHKLYAVCEACSLFTIHYKYMVEEKYKEYRVHRPFIRKEILWSVLWAALKTSARAKSCNFLHIYT